MSIPSGLLQHLVQLEEPTATPDGGGGYTTTWAALDPATAWASIEPATQRSLERLVANAVTAQASHIVTIWYHAGVTTKTRLVFGSRVLNVVGIQNVNERNEILRLACVEQVT